MSRLVLATADVDFEQRVRDAFDGELNGPLRYWRDDMLVDPVDAVRELGGRDVEVVALGPDMTEEHALALATAFDHDRPDISVVIIAPPSTNLLQSALRAGARDVIAPDIAPADLRAAIEKAFDTATHRRQVFDGDGDGGDDDRGRVIMALCPKGGAGKTTISSNLALALAQVAPGEVVILDLDVQFGDVASALGLRPELTFADAVRSVDTLDATGAQGAPLRPRRGPVRALHAGDAHRGRRHHDRTGGACPRAAHPVVQVRGDRHRLGARRVHARRARVRHRPAADLGHRRSQHPGDGEGDRGAAGHRQAPTPLALRAQPGRRRAPGSRSRPSSGPSASTSTSRSRARGRSRCPSTRANRSCCRTRGRQSPWRCCSS